MLVTIEKLRCALAAIAGSGRFVLGPEQVHRGAFVVSGTGWAALDRGERRTLLRSLTLRGLAEEVEHEVFVLTEAGWACHDHGEPLPGIEGSEVAGAGPGQYARPQGPIEIERGSYAG
jgi:hypothetical protein